MMKATEQTSTNQGGIVGDRKPICVALGTTHQGNYIRFKGDNAQCVAMSSCAAIYSCINNRRILSTTEMDTILDCGDALYLRIRPLHQHHPQRYLFPEELPIDIQIGSYSAIIKPMQDCWLMNGLYPSAIANDDHLRLSELKNYLESIFSNNHNDKTDNYLFTGHLYTVSFWKNGSQYFYYNSHPVDETNSNCDDLHSHMVKSRLFQTDNLEDLCKLLFRGIRVTTDNIMLSQYSISKISIQSYNVQSLNTHNATIDSSVMRLSSTPSSHDSDNVQLAMQPTVVIQRLPINPLLNEINSSTASKMYADAKISVLKPVVLLENIANKSTPEHNLVPKKGRPLKRKRGRQPTSNSNKAPTKKNIPTGHRNAVKRYSQKNPHINIDAVKRYSQKNPHINIDAVKRYSQKNPHINKDAVKRFSQKNPHINIDAVQRYTQKNPQINRDAVQRYTQKNPHINKDAVQRYTQKNPDVNKQAVSRYTHSHPDINKVAVSNYNISHRNVNTRQPPTKLIAQSSDSELGTIKIFDLKKSNLQAPDSHICPHCHACLFIEEKNRLKWCCGGGAYNVQNFNPLTEEFYSHPSFVDRPRAYNNLFAFSALGVSHGYQNPNTGISFLKVQGRVYHRVFDLAYTDTTNPIGLYIDDSHEREKLAEGLGLNTDVTRSITNFLHNVNPYIECFKRLHQEPSDEAHLIFEPTSRRTHGNILGDLPLGREVAAIISTDREQYIKRCIAIWKIGAKKPHTVDILHPLYESFQYPLLYPHGNPGWYVNRLDNNGVKLSQNKYTRCLLLSEPRFSELGRLSEEWLVDLYCRILEERLQYIANMQKKSSDTTLRAAPLEELLPNSETVRQIDQDETVQGEGGIVPGRIYLPNTFTGSPRYMKVKYMDAIALVNRLGTPSYFLTITCNPKWTEIQSNTAHGQKPSPQICARVFNLKLAQLLRDLRSGAWFGKCMYIIHVIEFQKRGLPHAHICFRVEDGGPIQSTDIDKFVRADIPNPDEAEGRLRKAVLDHMIHGPCGPNNRTDLPCWSSEKNKCSRYFPKMETSITYSDDKGFVHLRRDSKNEAVIKYRNKNVTVNDLWVVPYNAALLLKYDCHINLEVSSARTIVKYLFKYMTKGPDESRIAVIPDELRDNEIEQYVTKRYIGSCDAAWRVLEFDVTAREPNVKQLCVHLADRQTVFFKAGGEVDAAQRTDSDLLTYFKRPPGEKFENLTYLDFYEQYIVHTRRPQTKNVPILELSNGKFITARQRGELITRLFWISPNRGEQFYLRLLLNSHACRSYEDLYRLGGPECKTFQEAAKAVGLADDEVEYEKAMEEASSFLTGPRLRSFFVLLAANGCPVAAIWDKFRDQLSEDIINRMPDQIDKAYSLCLIQIDRLLRKHGSCLVEQGLPNVTDNSTELGRERIEYNSNHLREFVNTWRTQLSSDQRIIFDYIDQRLIQQSENISGHSEPRAIFIDGPAGTGKTLLLNVIAAHIRSRNGIVLCTASSGIAAQNYEGGITAHSMFRLPIDLVDDQGYWNITNGTQRAELIYHADLIIYDEAPMAHKYLIHLLDRSLRDLMKSDQSFGGKIVIFAGDFRQLPPVVPNAKTHSDVVNCSVKTSPLWQTLKTFSLITAQRCNEDDNFSKFLLDVGSDKLPTHELHVGRKMEKLVDLSTVSFVTELDELIDFVYPYASICDPDISAQRAILSTHNASVKEINESVLDRVPGDKLHFYSVDKMVSDNSDDLFFGVDTLNQLAPKGVPEHDLVLKVGCVCMVIRNLSFADGLVNGTKVIVVNTSPRLITVRKPENFENNYFIPRILFKAPIETGNPYEMYRRQFPLQVCYAMTIHKSQGQTINRVGIDLRSDVFSHGQLYVALGRVRDRQDIKILVHRDKVQCGKPYGNNVVYSQLIN